MEDEEWRYLDRIPGHFVSNLGRVKRLDFISSEEEIVEGFAGEDTHVWVKLVSSYGDHLYFGPLWKVVLSAFCWGSLDDLDIQHQNGDKTDNRLANLDLYFNDPRLGWRKVGWREDGLDRILDRRLGERIEIIETGQVFDSVSEVARAIGGHQPNVTAVLKGRLASHRGYSFRYV